MKKLLSLSFTIIFLLLVSCSESPKKEKIEIKFDSLIYDDNGKLFTGTKKGNVDGKAIEYEVVDGIKNGSFKTFYQNGNLEMKGQIENNKNTGKWSYYFEDGTLESEGNFEDDLVEGKWVWYYPSGKLKETADYKNGLRNGKLVMYDSQGKIDSEKIFEKGIEIK